MTERQENILELCTKHLELIERELKIEYGYTGEKNGYLINKGSHLADLMLESTESERTFILHKLAPELEVEDVYEGNHIILKLK